MDTTSGDTMSAPAERSPALQALDRLVGRWDVSGGATGAVSYEWLEGCWFLKQTVDLHHDGRHTTGVELIGHDRDFGSAPSADIRSCFYDSDGNTLRYVYEIDDGTVTIWAGERGSPAFYRGAFSADGATLTGEWIYPGGGYASTMVRVSEEVKGG